VTNKGKKYLTKKIWLQRSTVKNIIQEISKIDIKDRQANCVPLTGEQMKYVSKIVRVSKKMLEPIDFGPYIIIGQIRAKRNSIL